MKIRFQNSYEKRKQKNGCSPAFGKPQETAGDQCPILFPAPFRTAYPHATCNMVDNNNLFDYFNAPVEMHGK